MQVTVEFDPNDPAQIDKVKELLNAIDRTSASGSDAFDALWNRIGQGAAEFVKAAKKHTKPGQSFTYESLANATGESVETLKAQYRNLRRTVNNMGGSAPVLFTTKWSGQRQNYTLTDEARAAIAI
jgi:hypothetical protein